MKRLDAYWWDRNRVALALLPLSWLFCFVAWLRRIGYRLRLIPSKKLPVPVIVVGNITVGGSGKTPLVIWIAHFLKERGYRPGIISRGYGGKAKTWPQQVRIGSDPVAVGDEAILITNSTGCPMCVGPDRPKAAMGLVGKGECDIIISDDGMQHYALRRDIEIVVVDVKRGEGNGYCLPAGPLRERPSRLQQVDMVVANGGAADPQQHTMHLRQGAVVNLANPELKCSISDFVGKGRVHAVAGIGDPERFFAQLEQAGLEVIRHPFPDHHPFEVSDLQFNDEWPVLMTGKDAVKCSRFTTEKHWWYVQAAAELDRAFGVRLEALLKGVTNG